MTCGVARIVCVPTGEGYIIASVNCEKLYKDYMKQGRNGNLYTFQERYDVFGPKKFKLVILKKCKPKDLEINKQCYLDMTAGSELNLARSKTSRRDQRRREKFDWLPKSPSVQMQLKWAVPAVREKLKRSISQAAHRRFQNPEERLRISKTLTGRKASEETRAKMSESRRRQAPASEETRQKLADAARRSWASSDPERRAKAAEVARRPEVRAKLSAAMKLREPTQEQLERLAKANVDRIFTKEHRERIAAARRGKKHSLATRKKMSAAIRRSWVERKAVAGGQRASSPGKTRWKPSPEHQAKLHAANQRRKEEARLRRVYQREQATQR